MRTKTDVYRAIGVLVLVILAIAAMVQGVTATDWTIEAYAGNNGAISPSGTIIVSEGNDQSFTLTPNSGYVVSNLVVDGSSVGAVQEYHFTNVVSNHTISAVFVRTTYVIEASAGQGGTISPSGSISVIAGKSQTFAINPSSDYHIEDILVDGVSVGSVSSYPFTDIQSNHDIQASFSPDSGSFYINSNPQKAIIYLDGNEVGTTPSLVKDVTSGTHNVRLYMMGYQEWSTQVAIQPGETEIISPTPQLELLPPLTTIPTTLPTTIPTTVPTTTPTTVPTTTPSPTTIPTTVQTTIPTTYPTTTPTTDPTPEPTTTHTTVPTTTPTTIPTSVTTTVTTTISTTIPTTIPTTRPTKIPTTTWTSSATTIPTTVPAGTSVTPASNATTRTTIIPGTPSVSAIPTANATNNLTVPTTPIPGSPTLSPGTTVSLGNNTTAGYQPEQGDPAIALLMLFLTSLPAGLLVAGDLSNSAGKRCQFSTRCRALLAGGYAATAGLLLYSSYWVAVKVPGVAGTVSVVSCYVLEIASAYLACSGIALSAGAILSRPFDRMRKVHLIPGIIVSVLAPFILVTLGSGYALAMLVTFAAIISTGLALWQHFNSKNTAVIKEINSPTGPDTATQFTGGRTITSAEVKQDLFPSELRDRYYDMSFLGMGGMSRVFSARRASDGRMVAVKIPISFDTTTGKCFMKEILAWEGLRHENIVEITEANILPVPYVEMEYIRSTLDELPKPLPVRRAAEIVCGIAEGLAYAHERAIIHRDIKPQNILLTPEGIPKITDWGMSRAVGTSMLPTVTGFSLSYAAPEQVSPGKFGDTDQRTDIYQLGVVFYELVTGQSLFSGDDLVEVSTSITTTSPAPPSTINKDACGLDAIILKCLAKRPEERYDSVRSLLDDLHAYLRQEMPPTNPLTESETT